jgi:RNA polymerase sigma factor (sigma-70 family)
MGPQAGHSVGGEHSLSRARDTAGEYRRLLATLASRARWLGSRDPEAAAQEALTRSLENSGPQRAIEFYFSEAPPARAQPPEWPLDQLFAWLHGVLRYVVREELNRASYRREVPMGRVETEASPESGLPDLRDPAPNQLADLIEKELEAIVADCFSMLDRDYHAVLRMRVNGLTYEEIAARLGLSENTVATWISRGIRQLAQHVRRRTERLIGLNRGAER